MACIPIAVPKVFGLAEFNVITGSMEPKLPVGSLVYVKAASFEDLKEKDIIAFDKGATVITHRIVSINESDMLITTKGDANDANDFTPVPYQDVIGKVVFHIPVYGFIAAFISSILGKVCFVCLLVLGVVMSGLSGIKIEKNKKGNPKVLLVVGLLIIVGSVAGLVIIFSDYKQSEDLYTGVRENYVSTVEEDIPWQDMIDVDFDALQDINKDVVGWIYVEGTDISYPIMYSGDDEKYLRTGIDLKAATAGSIFLEGYNLKDFSDSHSIIYGHNMRNLSMFGSLKFYKTEEGYYDSHRYFQIITPEKKMRFRIFSYFDTDPASWVYTVPFSDSPEFEEYISELKRHSAINSDGVEIKPSNKIVTLSTCSVAERRFTLHGVMVDKEIIDE